MKGFTVLLSGMIFLCYLISCSKSGSANDPNNPPPTSAKITVTGFSPASDTAGGQVTITGSNFSTTPGNNVVKFDDVQATVVSATATQLVVTVPNGISTSSQISVTVSGQTVSTDSHFTLTTINQLLLTGTWIRREHIDSLFNTDGSFFSFTHFIVDTTDPYYKQKFYLTYQRNGTCLMPITIAPSPSNVEMRYIDFINDSAYSETLSDFGTGARSGPPFDTLFVKKQTESQLILLRMGDFGGYDSNNVYKIFHHHVLETYSR